MVNILFFLPLQLNLPVVFLSVVSFCKELHSQLEIEISIKYIYIVVTFLSCLVKQYLFMLFSVGLLSTDFFLKSAHSSFHFLEASNSAWPRWSARPFTFLSTLFTFLNTVSNLFSRMSHICRQPAHFAMQGFPVSGALHILAVWGY